MSRLVQFNFVRRGWPRADQAHLAAQHIQQVGKLVQAGAAQKLADSCDSRVIDKLGMARVFAAFAQHLGLQLLGIAHHAAKLRHAKCPAIFAHALLPKQHRTLPFQCQCQRHQQANQRPGRQQEQRQQHIHSSLQQLVEAPETAVRADAQKRDAVQIFHLHLADIQLHDLGHDAQVRPRFAADFGQLLNEVIMFPAESDDDGINVLLRQNRFQTICAAQSLHPPHADRADLVVIVQKTDRSIAQVGARQHDAQQRASNLAHAHDQHAPDADAAVAQISQDPAPRQPRCRASQQRQSRHINQHQAAGDQGLQNEKHRQDGHDGHSHATADQVDLFQPGAPGDIAVNAIALEVQPDQQRIHRRIRHIRTKIALDGVEDGADDLQLVAQHIRQGKDEKSQRDIQQREEPARLDCRSLGQVLAHVHRVAPASLRL